MGKTLQSLWLQRAWPPGEKAWGLISKSSLLVWSSNFLLLYCESWGCSRERGQAALNWLCCIFMAAPWYLAGNRWCSPAFRTFLPRCVLFWASRSESVGFVLHRRYSVPEELPVHPKRFMEYLLCARLCSRHWAQIHEQTYLASTNILMGKQTINQETGTQYLMCQE